MTTLEKSCYQSPVTTGVYEQTKNDVNGLEWSMSMLLIGCLPVLRTMTSMIFVLILVVAWFVWFNRNQSCHGQLCFSIQAAKIRTHTLLADFTRPQSVFSLSGQVWESVWWKPESNWVKFNIDAASSKETQECSACAVGWDNSGAIVGVQCEYLRCVNNSLEAEARGLWLAMLTASWLRTV